MATSAGKRNPRKIEDSFVVWKPVNHGCGPRASRRMSQSALSSNHNEISALPVPTRVRRADIRHDAIADEDHEGQLTGGIHGHGRSIGW